MIKVYTETYDYFEKHGHKPSFQHLDNESSKDLETYFKSKNIDFQFCDKDSHRRNLAERAIRDAKNHIVSMLATAHQDLPKGLWDTCIPHLKKYRIWLRVLFKHQRRKGSPEYGKPVWTR